MCVSPDEKILLTGGNDEDLSIRIWNLETLELLDEIEQAHNGLISLIIFKFRGNNFPDNEK